MGWTTYSYAGSVGRTAQELLMPVLNYENEHGSSKVIDFTMRGETAYVLIEKRQADTSKPCGYIRDSDGSFRFIAVILTSRRGGEFGYKDMDEGMGPCKTDCPKRILDAASPIEGDSYRYANEWRAKCYAKFGKNRKPTISQLKLGDKLVFSEPLYFGGEPEKTLIVTTYYRKGKNRKCFKRENGSLVRIDGLKDRDFIVNPE